ncbi:hypothetical protein J1N35_010638 [Gossypium stocksii]|uniref:Uncharacterized protein n=1 Tax=Gossypium stocksii TaxID=47602 RepID=A0A9D3W2X4_9ROSI|nr:hypothetical protein J1N35_010638 [Gossypium stocksii]
MKVKVFDVIEVCVYRTIRIMSLGSSQETRGEQTTPTSCIKKLPAVTGEREVWVGFYAEVAIEFITQMATLTIIRNKTQNNTRLGILCQVPNEILDTTDEKDKRFQDRKTVGPDLEVVHSQSWEPTWVLSPDTIRIRIVLQVQVFLEAH